MRICILGWGSLIREKRREFDDYHGPWQTDGPTLNLEFSRVSETRLNALTLVIDPVHGMSCCVACTESTRKNPDDAICDLRTREGTVLRLIGAMFLDGSPVQGGDEATRESIRSWAREKRFDVVIWTELPANFQKKTGIPFSVDAACTHLQGLSPEGKANAADRPSTPWTSHFSQPVHLRGRTSAIGQRTFAIRSERSDGYGYAIQRARYADSCKVGLRIHDPAIKPASQTTQASTTRMKRSTSQVYAHERLSLTKTQPHKTPS